MPLTGAESLFHKIVLTYLVFYIIFLQYHLDGPIITLTFNKKGKEWILGCVNIHLLFISSTANLSPNARQVSKLYSLFLGKEGLSPHRRRVLQCLPKWAFQSSYWAGLSLSLLIQFLRENRLQSLKGSRDS
jgi:hypothetical protein